MSLDEPARERAPQHPVAVTPGDQLLARAEPRKGDVLVDLPERIAELDAIAWNLPRRRPGSVASDAVWPADSAA